MTKKNAVRSPNAQNLLELSNIQKQKRIQNDSKGDGKKPDGCVECLEKLWISFFFDGTGQNRIADKPKEKLSNPAKLYEAIKDEESNGIYARYYPGVGTPFTEDINSGKWEKYRDSEQLGGGLGWGKDARLDDACAELANLVGKNPGRKIIYIAIFGFSRGAALSRFFANRIIKLCKVQNGVLMFQGKPLVIAFMGLFDTVASFAHEPTNLGGENLDVQPWVKKCVHMVAAHEARIFFPLSPIRNTSGYDSNGYIEYVYPGVHTDVGGGYPPYTSTLTDQSQWRGNELASIPLREMYKHAIAAGVPLFPIDEILDDKKLKKLFAVTPQALVRYNNYINEVSASGPLEKQAAEHRKAMAHWWGHRHTKEVDPEYAQRQKEIDAFLKEHPAENSWKAADAHKSLAERKTELDALIEKRDNVAYSSYRIGFEVNLLRARAALVGKVTDGDWFRRIQQVFRRYAKLALPGTEMLSPTPLDAQEVEYLTAYNTAKLSPAAMEFFDKDLHDSAAGFATEKIFLYRYFRSRAYLDENTPADAPSLLDTMQKRVAETGQQIKQHAREVSDAMKTEQARLDYKNTIAGASHHPFRR